MRTPRFVVGLIGQRLKMSKMCDPYTLSAFHCETVFLASSSNEVVGVIEAREYLL